MRDNIPTIVGKIDKKYNLLLWILIFVSLFLRLYRIADFTQFRGDQGSAGVVIYESVKNHTLPLVGPTVSTGQRPGPAYYYIIALPLILSGYHPLAPAVLFAILGVATVCILFSLGSKIWKRDIGFLIALIYALSPAVVAQNRNMWNPTAIPFFVSLVIWFFYKFHGQKKLLYLISAFFCIGILVQLHYTNIFVFFISCLFLFYKKTNWKWWLLSFLAFLLPLLPFWIYEWQNDFIDLRELFLMLLAPQSGIVFQPFVQSIFDVIHRAFIPLSIPLVLPAELIFLSVIISVPFIVKKNFWHNFFTIWLIVGMAGIALYKGPLFDHYLWFLYPIPFLLLGSFTDVLMTKEKIRVKIISFSAIFLAAFYIPGLDLFKPHIGDIFRTKFVATAMISESAGDPFSFTLISSPSFSDYHYRFFFRIKEARPMPIISSNYKWLYLICERDSCPSDESVKNMKMVHALCYDHVCKGEYPTVSLSQFKFIRKEIIAGARMYIFKRLPF